MNIEQIVMMDKKELVGIHKDIKDIDYHDQNCPGVSSSFLKDLITTTPRRAMYKLHNKQDTDSLMFGRAFHTAMESIDLFDKQYTMVPAGMRRDARSKAYQDFMTANAGKVALKEEEMISIMAMYKNVKEHKNAEILDGCIAESSVWWFEGDILCKCRPDLLNADDGYIVDFKTSSKPVDDKTFPRTIRDYKYNLSAAMYLRGLNSVYGTEKFKHFYIVACENFPDYDCKFYKLSDQCLKKGLEDFEAALMMYRECDKINQWPGYSQIIDEIGLPDEEYGYV